MMIEFIGKYFLLGDKHSPGDFFLFFMLIAFCACVGSCWGGMTCKAKDMVIGAVVGVFWALALVWLFVGDSFWFTEVVGNWFNTRR